MYHLHNVLAKSTLLAISGPQSRPVPRTDVADAGLAYPLRTITMDSADLPELPPNSLILGLTSEGTETQPMNAVR